ncbi:MAG: hypothetical protein KGZ56_00885 [Dethiobacter sp.]|nr:hypothetical protein [Dethiobacter sp.]MBS3898688.1 hypothetical protein [Dethiobacter sp.]
MQAIEKLRSEMEQNKNHRYIQIVGNFLVQYVTKNTAAAERILTEGKTIKGSLNDMKNEARKNQMDGIGVLSDEEGFAVVLKYYGITTAGTLASSPAPEKAAVNFDVSLDDLL